MSEEVKVALDKLAEDDFVGFEEAIQGILADRVNERLDAEKVSVAQHLFSSDEEPLDDAEEE